MSDRTDLVVDPDGPDPLTVFQVDADLMVELPDDDVIVEFAALGLPGRDGADGGQLIVGVAGPNLSGHRAVAHDAAGLLRHADPASAIGAQVIGVSTGAALSGAPVTVQCAGEMTEPSWTWSAGPIFLGSDGMMTQAAPATGCLVIVGYAAGPTRMIVAPRIVALLGG